MDVLDESETARSATTTTTSSTITTTSCGVSEKPRVVYEWRDVTHDLFEDTKELKLGELLHDDLFGLMEAMSAIEMMDPKMDAGMMRDEGRGLNGQPLTFHTASQNGCMKLEDISLVDRLEITTSTLQCMTTWLEGHSLAQTIFTNLYTHNVEEVGDGVVKPVAIVVLKLVDLIRDIVQRAGVFEEEDFQHLTFNFDLASSISDSKAVALIRGIEEEQQRALRRMKSTQNKDQTDNKQQLALESCLHHRVSLLRHLYQSLLFISKSELNEAQRCLNKCSDALLCTDNGLKDFEIKLRAVNDVMGFEKLANQRLLPPTFPRYTELHSWETCKNYISSLVQRLMLVVAFDPAAPFQWAQDCFVLFSIRPSCMLSRSCLQLVYPPIVAFTKTNLRASSSSTELSSSSSLWIETLKDACRAFISPPVLSRSANNSKQIRDCLDSFFVQCSRPLGFMMQTFGHNSARQRDKIVMLLEEFVAIQEEADRLDTTVHRLSSQTDSSLSSSDQLLYFSTWLLYSILKLMVRYILSGFELELYSHHEYCYKYWYLYEMIYPWIISCLHRADTHLVETELKNIIGKGRKKGKAGSKRKSRPHGREIAVYQGLSALCAGYFKLMVGLKREQKILLPQSLFDNEALRYERRFEPFAALLTPPLMHYGKYMEAFNSAQSLESSCAMFTTAGQEFDRSRHIFKSIMSQHPLASTSKPHPTFSSLFDDDINTLIAVGHNNHIVANVLARDCSRHVSFEFNPHPSFPTVKITQ